MQFTPLIAVHMSSALAAVVVGPVALWARRRGKARPRLHRAAGYAWVTLMLMTAISAFFIRDHSLWNIHGFTLIHLFIPATVIGLVLSFRYIALGKFAAHREAMQKLYFGACVGAGLFTLLPSRLIGHWLWGNWGLLG